MVLEFLQLCVVVTAVRINVGFHWHMHQPIYYPYESVVDTVTKNRFNFSVLDVFTSRAGPYNNWPADAITKANSEVGGSCGAQVSFTGALSENLNNLQSSSLTDAFKTYQHPWEKAQSLKTAKGNPALYLSAFGYHHPLMPLTEPAFNTIQILLHRLSLQQRLGVTTGPTGLFPPENCFSPRMIPALLQAGIRWVLVDNIHFDRAHADYPWGVGSNLYPPNPADQRNTQNTSWIQLNDVWCGSKISAPFGYRPYWVEYVDPSTGNASRIIAVPGARYEGVEDGRGGFGALDYEKVMSQYAQYNTDATRPVLTILAHDGDNYGGGTDSYYQGNFDNFIGWINGNPNFSCTTIDDYLNMYPVPQSEVIHVEDGSWSGANNGDPQFLKWNPNFFDSAYEPERNSWAVLTAGSNALLTAMQIAPYKSLNNILSPNGTASDTELALHYFLCGQASDYEYWPGVQVWDSDPTRSVNQALVYANRVIALGTDLTPPTIFLPQRQYWNPGAINWKPTPEPRDFFISTLVFDVSGVANVTLMLRITAGKQTATAENLIYAGGSWSKYVMTRVPLVGPLAPTTDPLPTLISDMYQWQVTGVATSLVDFYVVSADNKGNVQMSPIQSVYVA